MKLCQYTAINEKNCLAIFDSNTPDSFAVQERETFQRFLDTLAPPYSYFVVRDEAQKIVGCGGVKLQPVDHIAWLRWDMVAKECQKRSIGTFLTLTRLHQIGQLPEMQTARLCTSQHSYQFYEKIGFVVQRVIPDGIVPGMDEYFMESKLDQARIQELKIFSKRESFV